MTDPRAGRRCHNPLNALHSALYFSPEFNAETEALGLASGPGTYFSAAGYFAARSAAMGAVGPGTVTATFFNFSHALITQHIPAAWAVAAPAQLLAARLRAVDKLLRRLLGEEALASREMAEAAELALRATDGCHRAGRPLCAAEADQPAAQEPHVVLWQAATVLREHRGDGHIALLTHAGLDGLEALVSHTSSGRGFTPSFARTTRGWSEEEWSAARKRLQDRGLLNPDGELTEAGTALRAGLERETDHLASAPYDHLGAAGVERLTELAGGFAAIALANGAYPNGIFARN
ncbi:SCO6745 family protein [Streptomyces sp. IBSBF 2435]|uniref:SCO6745 family protein n=1 Tax=Streptomyces sp. IBSBF 2435 TaxID=2903531 RepID=UPI002FDC1C96